jgi:hypothetical protein
MVASPSPYITVTIDTIKLITQYINKTPLKLLEERKKNINSTAKLVELERRIRKEWKTYRA